MKTVTQLRTDDQKISPAAARFRRRLLVAVILTAVLSSIATVLVVGGGLLATGTIRLQSGELQRQVVVGEGELIADIASKVGPSVVSVRTSQEITRDTLYGPRSQTAEGAGTGIIVSKDGIVLTNKHVIPEGTESVRVTLSNGTQHDDVAVLGRDPLNDLAVLQIKNPKDLIPAKLGSSSNVRTGQKVVAIGNALGEFQNTVTSGIISGVGRPIQASDGNGSVEQLSNLFQTDAAINPGNSGGPLVDFNGEVIGVNTAVAEGAQGVGFAIPINEAKPIVESAKETGEVTRAYLGVQFTMLNKEVARQQKLAFENGAYIGLRGVVKGSPAEQAGLRPEDVILRVNDTRLSEAVPLSSAVAQYRVGDEVKLTVLRDGKEVQINATLGEAPSR